MSFNMEAWTYGLGNGWLVGMKAAARAQLLPGSRTTTGKVGWLVLKSTARVPGLGYHAGGPGGRTGMS